MQDAEMLKEAWDTLLKNEYSMNVKGLVDSLGSIGAPIDDEDYVYDLGWSWERICTISSIGGQENFPDF